jgi:translation initiation factor 1
MRPENPTVYSTESGRICPDCGRPVAACVCKSKNTVQKGDGVVRVRQESKGRKGKTVTVVMGMGGSLQSLQTLASDLKRLCGAGGAVKEGTIEIQGEHADQIVAELKKRGMNAKRAGG